MISSFGILEYLQFGYLLAKPRGRLDTIEQGRLWRRCLLDLIHMFCGESKILVCYGSHDIFAVDLPNCSDFAVRNSAGKEFKVFESHKLTVETINDYIIESPQFEMGDLFLWKPTCQDLQSTIREILDWRMAMYQQPVPFSRPVFTDQQIGIPANDGEWFYWINPDHAKLKISSYSKTQVIDLLPNEANDI